MSRVLFILKRRGDYNQDCSYSEHGVSTGLLNSATFVSDMLNEAGIESKVVVVVDNNGIDKEVALYKPTHAIIEALWVVPEKFDVLCRLHKQVKWIVRYHSETPFIAMEGIAMRWTLAYMKHDNVVLGINAPRFLREVQVVLHAAGYTKHQISQRVVFLPNYYPIREREDGVRHHKDHVDVGCFGAIRPLKNHLIQAIAALDFADQLGKPLHFHINVGRVEGKGDPILHNLQGMFAGLQRKGHKLVEHQWTPHEKFIDIIRKMDVGMQVSFSETFNIVAADMITSGVPMVMSAEIPWAKLGVADPTDSVDIADTMKRALQFRSINLWANNASLRSYVAETKEIWIDAFA